MKGRKMLPDCPDLMRQWDYRKNVRPPTSLTAGSGYMAWWLCEKGHSWQATVNHRHHGTDCPYCANRLVERGVNDLKTLNPLLAAQWNCEKNGGLSPEEVPNGTHRKVWWRCPEGHEWKAEIISRVAGTGCPYCAGRLPIQGITDLATMRPDLAAQFDVSKNIGLLPTDICYASNKKYWWICIRGHSWQASASTRQRSGCPICAGKTVLLGINDLLTHCPELAKQWDYEKNKLLPSEVTVQSGKIVWWRCSHGHSWKARVADRQAGNGCPYCSGRVPVIGENDLQTVSPEVASEWDDDKNEGRKPDQFLPQSNVNIWWKCKCGYSWKAPIYRRYLGSGCPACAGLVILRGVNDLLSQQSVLARQWDSEKNHLSPDEVHVYSNKYAWWVCHKGHSWKAIINNRTSKGRGCPYCSGYLAIPGETDLLTRCPKIASEWDYDKNIANIRTVTEHSHMKAWWKCDKGHSWVGSVNARRRGNGCPYCAGKRAIPGETDLLTVAPHLEKEWCHDLNTISMTELTLKSNVKVWWVCEHGHIWKTQVINRAIGCGCPYCDGKTIYSAKNVKG